MRSTGPFLVILTGLAGAFWMDRRGRVVPVPSPPRRREGPDGYGAADLEEDRTKPVSDVRGAMLHISSDTDLVQARPCYDFVDYSLLYHPGTASEDDYLEYTTPDPKMADACESELLARIREDARARGVSFAELKARFRAEQRARRMPGVGGGIKIRPPRPTVHPPERGDADGLDGRGGGSLFEAQGDGGRARPKEKEALTRGSFATFTASRSPDPSNVTLSPRAPRIAKISTMQKEGESVLKQRPAIKKGEP